MARSHEDGQQPTSELSTGNRADERDHGAEGEITRGPRISSMPVRNSEINQSHSYPPGANRVRLSAE
jgi:hypothetical protein